ncbi:protein serine/threonine kinase [Gracilaria domingensis]|nr:protein serine/threonine kinase [Gracilaria domingensis]
MMMTILIAFLTSSVFLNAVVSTEPCQPGYYLNNFEELGGRCEICPPGTRDMNGFGCTQCGYLTYQPQAGQTECLPCPSNTYSLSGATECVSCPEDEILLENGTCGVCGPGKYYEVFDGYCDACASGFFKREADLGPCLPCPPGTFSIDGATECLLCPHGQAIMYDNSCGACPPGKFYDAFTLSCIECPSGSYTDSPNVLPRCYKCGGNSFSTPGSTECHECPIGHVFIASSRTCERCTPGQIFNEKQLSCEDCPVNHFTRHDNELECIRCYPGSFARRRSATCFLCPRGTSYMAHVDECFACPHDYPYDVNEALCRPESDDEGVTLGGHSFGDLTASEEPLPTFSSELEVQDDDFLEQGEGELVGQFPIPC